MDNTEKKLQNYFDAASNFMNAWLELLQSLIPEDETTKEALSQLSGMYNNLAENFVQEASKSIAQQKEYLEKITPEKFQKESLSAFQEYEKNYMESTKMMQKLMKKQEEFMQSDDYLDMVKANLKTATIFYQMALDNMSAMVNSLSKMMKN